MATKVQKPMMVRVTAKDIRGGTCGDVFHCAVAVALQRATGDSEARVVEKDWEMRLEVWGRSLYAPCEVLSFVWEYDHKVKRGEGSKPVLGKKLPEAMRPFTFEIPPLDDPRWKEECYGCEELREQSELDSEGYCFECGGEIDEDEDED